VPLQSRRWNGTNALSHSYPRIDIIMTPTCPVGLDRALLTDEGCSSTIPAVDRPCPAEGGRWMSEYGAGPTHRSSSSRAAMRTIDEATDGEDRLLTPVSHRQHDSPTVNRGVSLGEDEQYVVGSLSIHAAYTDVEVRISREVGH
jgi:hypothetical protein